MRTEARTISAEIPTSSTADIAFLLVVFFMLTVTFAAQKGLDMDVPPEDDATVVDPIESVHVEILIDGSLRVDGRGMFPGELLAYLRPRLEANPEKPVILDPDEKAPYGALVETYDTLRLVGEQLELPRGIVIALPTAREIARFWN